MAIIGIIGLILAPLLIGAFILGIFRERDAGVLITYATGFLSLFVFFLACLLAALKLDFTLRRLELVFFVPVAVLSVCGIWFALKVRALARVSKKSLLIICPAVVLAAVSFFLTAPSFVNDDTWEVVATTLSTNTVYEYSAMTGEKMLVGLPIFNKIYEMPMFYCVWCDFFKIPLWIIGGFVVPIVVFTLNIAFACKISDFLKVNRKEFFVVVYMLMLLAGTYLPSNGIPVTEGYAVLREGYSGYAVAYGVVFPFALYLFLKKRYLLSATCVVPALGLLRLDRMAFAVLDFASSAEEINVAGKLAGLFIIAVISGLILKMVANRNYEWKLMLIPALFISYETCKLRDIVSGKKKVILFDLGVAAVILSACSFSPFKDARFLKGYLKEVKAVEQTISQLAPGTKIWAPLEFVEISRKLDGRIRTNYGRDDVSGFLLGLDFEEQNEFSYDYCNHIENIICGNVFYGIDHDPQEIYENALSEGTEYLVLRDGNGYRAVDTGSFDYPFSEEE